jgi:MFS family permease
VVGGQLGAVVGPLSADFDISLTTVGLLSGTILLGFSVVGTVLAPTVAERLGIVRTLVAAAVLCAAGNVIFAVTPVFAGLVAGRMVAELGLGLSVVPGPVLARATGGVAQVALFGAGIELGIAGGLGTVAILGDLGVDWRVTFVLSAAVALSPLPFLLGRDEIGFRRGGGGGYVRLAVPQRARLAPGDAVPGGRLGAVDPRLLARPLPGRRRGLATAPASALSFVMFGVSAAAREAGGTLTQRGFSPGLLAGGAPFLAAAGLAILVRFGGVGLGRRGPGRDRLRDPVRDRDRAGPSACIRASRPSPWRS